MGVERGEGGDVPFGIGDLGSRDAEGGGGAAEADSLPGPLSPQRRQELPLDQRDYGCAYHIQVHPEWRDLHSRA